MKKYYVIYILVLFLLSVSRVKGLSVSENNISMVKGDTKEITLYANTKDEINEVTFDLTFSSYDISAMFSPNNEFTYEEVSGIKNKISFNNNLSGKIELGKIIIKVKEDTNVKNGFINIQNAYGKGEKEVYLNNQNIYVNVTNEENIDKYLERIESNIVDINIKDKEYEYTVLLDEECEELDLKPILISNKYTYDISSQKLSEDNNKITINIKKENENIATYTINVKKSNNIKDVIDNSKFTPIVSYKKNLKIILIFCITFLVFGIVLLIKNKK